MEWAEVERKLSLREAAERAGVSEPTMRSWVKSVKNVTRNDNGGYGIPVDELMNFLRAKQSPRLGASSAAKAKVHEGETSAHLSRMLDRAEGEVTFLRERVKELEALLGKANANFSSLMSEYVAVYHNGPQPGLSAWTHKSREHESRQSKPVIDVAPVRQTKAATPKTSVKKTPSKAAPKKKATKARKAKR